MVILSDIFLLLVILRAVKWSRLASSTPSPETPTLSPPFIAVSSFTDTFFFGVRLLFCRYHPTPRRCLSFSVFCLHHELLYLPRVGRLFSRHAPRSSFGIVELESADITATVLASELCGFRSRDCALHQIHRHQIPYPRRLFLSRPLSCA